MSEEKTDFAFGGARGIADMVVFGTDVAGAPFLAPRMSNQSSRLDDWEWQLGVNPRSGFHTAGSIVIPAAPTLLKGVNTTSSGAVKIAEVSKTARTNLDLLTAERHLEAIGGLDFQPNQPMLAEIRGAAASGLELSPAQRTFLSHEMAESQLVETGLSVEEAHATVTLNPPVGANYSPEVLMKYSEWFSPPYFDYWGISK